MVNLGYQVGIFKTGLFLREWLAHIEKLSSFLLFLESSQVVSGRSSGGIGTYLFISFTSIFFVLAWLAFFYVKIYHQEQFSAKILQILTLIAYI